MRRSAIIIPARLAANRLPNKPLADLGGVPLVVRVAAQASKAVGVERVIIATDAEPIAAAAREHGYTAVLTDPTHHSGTDRVAEVARDLDHDVIVNLQGDEPFVHPADLGSLIEAFDDPAVEIATLRAPLATPAELEDPNVVKVVCNGAGRALYFSRAPIPHGASHREAWGHLGVYAYRREALLRWAALPPHPLEHLERLEQLRALAAGMVIAVRDAHGVATGIDTEEDLARARARIEQMGEDAFPSMT